MKFQHFTAIGARLTTEIVSISRLSLLIVFVVKDELVLKKWVHRVKWVEHVHGVP